MSELSSEFEPQEATPDFTEKMIADAGVLFDTEHRAKKPQVIRDHLQNSRFGMQQLDLPPHDIHVEIVLPKRTIEEKIESARCSVSSRKSLERRHGKASRSRRNFDTEFHIAVSFQLDSSKVFVEEKPDAEVGLMNRIDLYRYLQQIGMVLIDDTGRSEHGGEITTSDRGYLMLPKEIDHKDYFDFEDEIRKSYPFHYVEFDLVRLIQEQAGHAISESQDFAGNPRSMMELVDELSLDERFMGLFETARNIKLARVAKPRADIDDVPEASEEVIESTEEDESSSFGVPYFKRVDLTAKSANNTNDGNNDQHQPEIVRYTIDHSKSEFLLGKIRIIDFDK